MLLGQCRDRARDTDAVGTHRDVDRLRVRTQRVEPERCGVLAAELEDVADLDATGDRQSATAPRTEVTVADLDSPDFAVRLEVSTAHNRRGVPARLVRTGNPGTARDHERIDQVANAQLFQDLRADVALDQPRLRREVGRLGLCNLGWLELALEPLEVDLPIAGHTDNEKFPVGGARG